MSLEKQLMEELKDSMKTKDKVRKNTITMVRAAMKQREVDERIKLSDQDILDIMSKQLKEKRMSIEEFKKGDRQDLVDLTESEIEILLKYLPQQLTEDEVEKIVRETIEEVDAKSMKDIGIIMKAVMPKVEGKTDGKVVNKIARKVLN